ncbi:hypothetical protein T484DRAFT_1904798 [Baffinella frigidus]|nr:hypothetical protein T484DRAFT_1904798 [Cryptophyta sp. CCMP2293]
MGGGGGRRRGGGGMQARTLTRRRMPLPKRIAILRALLPRPSRTTGMTGRTEERSSARRRRRLRRGGAAWRCSPSCAAGRHRHRRHRATCSALSRRPSRSTTSPTRGKAPPRQNRAA